MELYRLPNNGLLMRLPFVADNDIAEALERFCMDYGLEPDIQSANVMGVTKGKRGSLILWNPLPESFWQKNSDWIWEETRYQEWRVDKARN